jgi:hypothetical protein
MLVGKWGLGFGSGSRWLLWDGLWKKTGVETKDASLESPNLASDYDGSRVDGGFAFGSKGTGMDAMVILA